MTQDLSAPQTLPRWEVPNVAAPLSAPASLSKPVAVSHPEPIVSHPASSVTAATDVAIADFSVAEPPSITVSVSQDIRPHKGRWKAWRNAGIELVSSVGEWVGVVGPTSNWMSRLTCAAVMLVLVSGLSLLMATSEPPVPVDDVAIEAFRSSESVEGPIVPTRENSVQQTGGREAPAREANAQERSGPIESAVYQTTDAPRNRGAWLDGRIELE